jgi:hypothetical protein
MMNERRPSLLVYRGTLHSGCVYIGAGWGGGRPVAAVLGGS